ncbi:hypothetical protein CLV62_12265 [Dysgonomonas alginatilytica]|uniref:Uncharacterized protein n=1 Tax=Dysgonomonas alginatilytica TaxID=1605892 RepID=A0A2V3PMK9_9BACT|nr:hypothetical protein CLV62_12265 [Dysgonomonas alginatilytica]
MIKKVLFELISLYSSIHASGSKWLNFNFSQKHIYLLHWHIFQKDAFIFCKYNKRLQIPYKRIINSFYVSHI